MLIEFGIKPRRSIEQGRVSICTKHDKKRAWDPALQDLQTGTGQDRLPNVAVCTQ